jgi:hypothetical protein
MYKMALRCSCSAELRANLAICLAESAERRGTLRSFIDDIGLDPDTPAQGREEIRQVVRSLVRAIEHAGRAGGSELAEIVAGECVAHARNNELLDYDVLRALVSRLKQPAPAKPSPVWPSSMAGSA